MCQLNERTSCCLSDGECMKIAELFVKIIAKPAASAFEMRKKNLCKSKKLLRGVQSSAARSRCEVVNATGGTPPLRAPPPQAPLHYRTIHHAGKKNIFGMKNSLRLR